MRSRQGDRRLFSKYIRNLIVWAFILVVVLYLVLPLYQSRGPSSEEIPYSAFVSEAQQGQIDQVKIGDEAVTGSKKDGRPFRTYVPKGDSSYIQLLRDKGVKISVEPPSRSSLWPNLLSTMLPFLVLVGLWMLMLRQAQSGSNQAMSFGKSRARLHTEAKTRVTFDDVAGVDEAKEELEEIIEFLRHPKKFQALGAKIPRGVLLVGPPGSGKTLLAKAIAGEAGVPFFSISGSEFVEMFVGVGASRVRDLFDQAKKSAPCLVFIDEIDAVGRQRGAGLGGGHDEREQTLNQLLVEMDGFDPNSGIIVIAATNRPDILDPALLRPGRFDRRIVVDNPDTKGRRAILGVHVRGKPIGEDANLDVLARRTAYHESGHALLGKLVPQANPPHKVTILPRGMALGYTIPLPQEEKYTVTRSEILANITAILGGRVAEEIVFGEITTGAANDFEKATELARKMVTEFGMSDKLGPLTLGTKHGPVFLGRDLVESRNYSEEIAYEIDKEVRRIIDECYGRARAVLTEHKDVLDRIAQALLEREALESEELDALIAGRALPPEEPVVAPPAPAPTQEVKSFPRPETSIPPKLKPEATG